MQKTIRRYSSILALLACGCGNSGSTATTTADAVVTPPGQIANYTVPGVTLTTTSSNGSVATVTSTAPAATTNLSFSEAAFSATKVATLVARNMPASETNANASGTATAARVERGLAAPGGRDLRPDLAAQETKELGEVLNKVSARVLAKGALPTPSAKYSDETSHTFTISFSGQTATCTNLTPPTSQHCTVYVENTSGGQVLTQSQVNDIVTAWDSSNPNRAGSGIYDQVRAIAGSEYSPGRDGDTKVVLVFVSATTIGDPGLYGYFNPSDEFPKADRPSSNEGEILYFNANKIADTFDIYSTMAHEFQHLISYNNKVIRNGSYSGSVLGENTCIDEGRSVLVEDLTGYGLSAAGGGSSFIYEVVRDYLEDTTVAGLFEFPSATSNSGYGRGYTFQRFLYDRVGAAAYLAYSSQSETGLAGLNASFSNFNQIYTDYTNALKVSSLVNAPDSVKYSSGFNPSGTYTIRGSGSRTLPGVVPIKANAPAASSSPLNLPAWSFGTFEYSGGTGQTLNVSLQVPSTASGSLVVEDPRGTFSGLK